MRIDHPCEGQIPALKAIWKEAFGDTDAFISSFFDTAFTPERCCCISQNSEVMAAAYWFQVEFSGYKGAYIYAVATAQRHRGKGLCRALMEHIHEHLQTRGYDGTMLVPGDAGLRNMYAGMGYASFGGMDSFTCEANGIVDLAEITPETFAALRRNRLPIGGVVQENENLDFLRRHYRFYRGGDFLLAATMADGALFVPEFWGDRSRAGEIVAALGAEKGAFRTMGRSEFAMYRPLGQCPAPAYFGFAFD